MSEVTELAHAHELIKQQRFDESAAVLKQIITATPQFSQAHYALGYVYFQVGRLNEASAELKEALALNPHEANAAYYLGELAAKSGSNELARRYFERALEIEPAHLSALQKLDRHHDASHPTPHPEATKPGGAGVASVPNAATEPAAAPAQSAFLRMLNADPSAISQEIVGLIRKLEMNVRPRMAPFLLPQIVGSLLIFAVVWGGLNVLGSQHRAPLTPLTAESFYHTATPTPQQIAEIDRANRARVTPASEGGSAAIKETVLVGLAVLLSTALLIRVWILSQQKYVFNDGRIIIMRGIFRKRNSYEMYRIIDASLSEPLFPKLTGDGLLTIIHKQDNTEHRLHLLGLAKYDKLTGIHDTLRELAILLRSTNWGKGVIY